MDDLTLGERLRQRGVSRRGFMKFCAALTSTMALPAMMVPKVAAALEKAQTTLGHLALVPGMHRMHRVVDAQPRTDDRGSDFRSHLARLSPYVAGCLG